MTENEGKYGKSYSHEEGKKEPVSFEVIFDGNDKMQPATKKIKVK